MHLTPEQITALVTALGGALAQIIWAWRRRR